jgi:hypothetical protein
MALLQRRFSEMLFGADKGLATRPFRFRSRDGWRGTRSASSERHERLSVRMTVTPNNEPGFTLVELSFIGCSSGASNATACACGAGLACLGDENADKM